MSRDVTRASLLELLRDGRLGPIEIGCLRDRLIELLGPPTDSDSTIDQSQILRYGDVEFHLDHTTSCVNLIHMDAFSGVPRGDGMLELDPWIIRDSLVREDLERELRANGVWFCEVTPQDSVDESVRLRIGENAEVIFGIGDSPYALKGLCAISAYDRTDEKDGRNAGT